MTGRPNVPSGAVEIPVGGYFALVDEADYELVARYSWSASCDKYGLIYAKTTLYPGGGRRVHLSMHRLVANTPVGLDTDHRNGNGLDNRRANLRPATKSQNAANTRKRRHWGSSPCTSSFKGVSWNRARNNWRVTIKVGDRNKNLGSFVSEVEAARTYDRAALEVYGEFARLNFPAAAAL